MLDWALSASELRLSRNYPPSKTFLKKRVAQKTEVRIILSCRADVAQLVEHNLAKVGVAGSNPVVRSIY